MRRNEASCRGSVAAKNIKRERDGWAACFCQRAGTAVRQAAPSPSGPRPVSAGLRNHHTNGLHGWLGSAHDAMSRRARLRRANDRPGGGVGGGRWAIGCIHRPQDHPPWTYGSCYRGYFAAVYGQIPPLMLQPIHYSPPPPFPPRPRQHPP